MNVASSAIFYFRGEEQNGALEFGVAVSERLNDELSHINRF